MKILHIIDSLGLGGAQTVVKGIFEKQKNNKNIFLFALRNREITTKINHKNVVIYNSNSKYSLLPLFDLKRIIKKNNIDILHCHLFRSQVFGWILKKFYFPKIKLIIHEHGQIFQKDTHYNYLMKKIQNKVDLFIAVSKATKRKLIENAGIQEDRIKVLYNFVDLERFNPEILKKYNRNKEREKLGIEKNDFVVGFAGRLVKRKGWEEFIKSAKIISEKNTKIKFLIVGSGPDKEKLIKLINKLNLRNKILYIGFVPDVRSFYSMLDCFVMPSHWEPSPMIFYEVQSLGIPLICADAVSVNELIKNKKNALLFKLKNKKDLSEKIKIICNDKNLRKKLIKNGLNEAKKYSLENYLIKLGDIYEK